MINKTCIRKECTTSFDTKDNRKKYCSRSCAVAVNNSVSPKIKKSPNSRQSQRDLAKANRKSQVDKWLSGEWDGTVKSGLSSSIRKHLLETAGYHCQDGRSGCNGWGQVNPKSGKSCLTVDHTDGNSTNNSPSNLVVMCPNCHSMTTTYGALNKGNGRTTRYQSVGV